MTKIKIMIAFIAVGSLAYSLNAVAIPLQTDEIKTIEQMNARLDFLFGSHDDYYAFIDQLKEDVTHQNKAAVAAVVKYPLKVDIANKRVLIKNQQQFIQNYQAIITPKVKESVAKQEFIGMFANGQGMMFGSGQLWISGYCLDKTCKDPAQTRIYIKAINN
ncbi:hypothetical protein [Commensalibacter communis]|uniref:hypothetical protein n=1 Tax=Commensalibacter communis TaxID=2972786 RepID=UPI0022FF75BD|nr:hypothetical protein [Commensalibacter communis]CAI3937856.1 DUF1311 family (YecT) (PDB:3GI7) [Commensalibacter communis]CAI3940335.1 DUF1311 family (YecT) (PDB:3GI7) [Commensalibacter communis]